MKSRMIEKKNEIYIQKGRESYSLNYIEEDACREPEIIINSMGFYDVIEGLLEIPKDVYKKGITKSNKILLFFCVKFCLFQILFV